MSETCPKCGQPYRHTSNCGYIVFACGTMVYEKSGDVSHGVDCLETQLTASQAEAARLRALIECAIPYVDASNKAEHMLDGFGKRSTKPSDLTLAQLRAALAPAAEERE